MALSQRDINERWFFLARVRKWVKEAVADGWVCEPMFKHEAVTRTAKLTKEGFEASAIMREPEEGRNKYPDGSLLVWGPDKMVVEHVYPYNWGLLREALQLCQFCGKTFEGKAFHVAFADRACQLCGPEKQGKLPRNWAD